MRHFRLAVFVCLAAALGATGCRRDDARSATPTAAPAAAPTAAAPATQPAAQAPPAAPFAVSSIELGKEIKPDKRVAEAITVFAPTDTIYASVVTSGTAPSVTLKARWTYEDGQLVNESEQTIAPQGPSATEFHIARPSGWPAGKYKVEIAANGAPAGSKDFEVRDAAPPPG